MKSRNILVGLGLLMALALWVTACAPGTTSVESEPGQASGATPEVAATTAPATAAPTDTVPAATAPAAGIDLDGTRWDVIELNGAPAPTTGKGTLDFEGEQVGGVAFCNSFGGTYSAESGALTLGEIARTLMACADMQAEDEYLTALGSVAAYRTDGDNLILSDAAGHDLIVLRLASLTALEGTPWTLTGIGAGDAIGSPLSGTAVTATLDGSTLSGTAGCNSYSASYTLDGATLTLGPAVSTKMACLSPDGVMDQENAFLVALSSVAAYRVNRAGLTLLDAGGNTLLTFSAAD